MKIVFSFLVSLVFSFSARASLQELLHSGVYGQSLVFVNPPQPSLQTNEGGSKWALQVGYMSLVEESSTGDESVEMRGLDLAVLYHWHLSPSWGVYGLVSTAQHQGDLSSLRASGTQLLATDVESQLTMLGVGSTYSVFRNEIWSIPLSFGPTFSFGQMSSRIREVSGGSSVTDDFDLSSDLQYLGWMAGVQVAYHFNPQFSLVPYVMFHTSLSSDADCQKFSASQVRVSGTVFSGEESSCSATSSGATSREFSADIFSHSLGLNFAFPGVGLTVGLFAKTKDHPLLSSASPQHYGLALAFGSL